MKFVLAFYGTRGDVEPGLAVGRELQRRGHDVRMAVAPDLVGFVESAGLPAVAYGLETQAWLDAYRNFWTSLFGSFWKIQDLRRLWREIWEPIARCWEEISKTLMSLAEGADLLFTGLAFERAAANVAEYYDIPFATLHYVPVRPHGQLLPSLPAPLGRSAMTVYEWLDWRVEKKVEDAQRRELGLPKATCPAPRRIAERGSLEIQAYDEVCFPGLAAEWTKWDGRRPFVGALTMELPTDADEEVRSWIAGGTPPIFFGFGSMPVESPADTLAMIAAACAELGERALVCSGWSDFSDLPMPGTYSRAESRRSSCCSTAVIRTRHPSPLDMPTVSFSLWLSKSAHRRRTGWAAALPRRRSTARLRIWYNSQLKSKNYIVPGLIALILMIIGALLTSLTLAREWEMGTMEQLLSTPLRPAEVALGKMSAYFALGLIDMLLTIVVGVGIFKVPQHGSYVFSDCDRVSVSGRRAPLGHPHFRADPVAARCIPAGDDYFISARFPAVRICICHREYAATGPGCHLFVSDAIFRHDSQRNFFARRRHGRALFSGGAFGILCRGGFPDSHQEAQAEGGVISCGIEFLRSYGRSSFRLSGTRACARF